MDWIWLALAAAVFSIIAVSLKHDKKRLPPGPRGIPILGHLHLLGNNPNQDLAKLAKKHGPIMYMRFGLVPVIVVSSPQAAEQFLKTHDLVFASRPPLEASKHISYGQRGVSFAPYGPYWRNARKFCTLHLLSNLKINSFQAMRKEELSLLVESLKQAAQDGGVVDLSAKVSTLNADMTCKMLFGKKYSDEELGGQGGFRDMIQEIMDVIAAPNLGDYFPFLGAFDIQGLTRRCKTINKVFDAFLETIIHEHEQSANPAQTKDFVDTMLDIMSSEQAEFEIDRRHVKAILLDILAAAMDTSASVIEWTFSELLKHPRVIKKVQEELDKVVGINRFVEESDLNRLEYLDLVVKESLRLHPVGSLLLPHEAMEDFMIDGFHIPKKSRIIINVWAIGQDPNIWRDPGKFIPERFIDSNVDLRGRDFQFIPFGSGRRSCPGMHLGLIIVRLVVAQLAHCFDWKLPCDTMPSDLDMTEHFGLVVTRAKHLMAIPKYRLQCNARN